MSTAQANLIDRVTVLEAEVKRLTKLTEELTNGKS